ncbi:MAG: type I restriction endonuclease subunit R, partial [Acidobacteriota bacterium]|nr:type I restriction endonuclease subunit R [Acidobacteriota bacterium]
EQYAERVAELKERFAAGQLPAGEQDQQDFIALFGRILRLRNILTSFDEFEGDQLLSERDLQNHQSVYLELYMQYRQATLVEREPINDDLVFEIELAKQVEVTVDYILMLVQKYLDEKGTGEELEIRATISRAVDASPSLRNKKDLIERFVDSLTVSAEVEQSWREFIEARRSEELNAIIADEGLDREMTTALVADALRDGVIPATGTAVTNILPPVTRFSPEGRHAAKKRVVLEKLQVFLERFSMLV